MKKHILIAALSLSLALILMVGTTVSYLTYTDSKVNVMTVGSIKIQNIELERIEQSDENTAADNTRPYTQEQPLLPAVGTEAYAAKAQQWPTGGEDLLFDDGLKNVRDKAVFVQNYGKSDAYVRTLFAFEAGDMNAAELNKMIHTNRNPDDWTWTEFSEDLKFTTEDGVNYYIRIATYNKTLESGKTTEPSLLQIYLDPSATNEDVAKFGDSYKVMVFSQACQTAGFKTAEESLTAGFGEISADNHPWEKISDPSLPATPDDTDKPATDTNSGADTDTDTGDTDTPIVNGAGASNAGVNKNYDPINDENTVSVSFTGTEHTITAETGKTYRISGTYENDVTIHVQYPAQDGQWEDVRIDGSGATFKGNVLIDESIANSYADLNNYTQEDNLCITNFNVEGGLFINSYGKDLVIEHNSAYALSVVGGKTYIKVYNNDINGHFGTYSAAEHSNVQYGMSFRITDYGIAFGNNVVTDTYSHAIGINGRQGESANDWVNCGTGKNAIDMFYNNTIRVNSTAKTERAAIKIWSDGVYAPVSGETPTEEAKTFAAKVLNSENANRISLGDTHVIFDLYGYTTNDGINKNS